MNVKRGKEEIETWETPASWLHKQCDECPHRIGVHYAAILHPGCTIAGCGCTMNYIPG